MFEKMRGGECGARVREAGVAGPPRTPALLSPAHRLHPDPHPPETPLQRAGGQRGGAGYRQHPALSAQQRWVGTPQVPLRTPWGALGPPGGVTASPHPPAQGTVPIPACRVRPSCITRLFVVWILFLRFSWDSGPAANSALCQRAGSDLGWGGRGSRVTPRLYTVVVL